MKDLSTPSERPFHLIEPAGVLLPIVVSIPHCGAAFPAEVREEFVASHLQHPDDTDWFVDVLYDFAPAMGISILHSRYCRYVIDLNRDPESKPLYTDGRTVTGLVSGHTFLEQPLYQGKLPDDAEIQRRKQQYYWPYHQELRRLLEERKTRFGHVLLWEAHSIRRLVPTIRSEPFPDMILGDADGQSAGAQLSALALQTLRRRSGRDVNHNDPFKGGYITRAFGQPAQGFHALQLEMAKDLYMDDTETFYDANRALTMRRALESTLQTLAQELDAMATEGR